MAHEKLRRRVDLIARLTLTNNRRINDIHKDLMDTHERLASLFSDREPIEFEEDPSVMICNECGASQKIK